MAFSKRGFQTCIQRDQGLVFFCAEKTAHIESVIYVFWKKRERSAHAVVVLHIWRRAGEERKYMILLSFSGKSWRGAHMYVLIAFWKSRRGAHQMVLGIFWKRGGAHMSIPAWISGKEEERTCPSQPGSLEKKRKAFVM